MEYIKYDVNRGTDDKDLTVLLILSGNRLPHKNHSSISTYKIRLSLRTNLLLTMKFQTNRSVSGY
jgi:hypothetical protein